MLLTLVGGGVTLLPWLFGLLGLLVLLALGWRVGLPALRIAELKARLDLFETKLLTATEKAETAAAREKRCIEELQAARADLEKAHKDVRVLVDAIEIKHKLDVLASQLQPQVMEESL